MQIKTERNGKTFPRLLTRGHVHLDGIDLDCLACRLWSEDRASQPLPAGPGQPQPRSTHSLPQPARLKCGWQSNLHQEHAGPQTITSLNPRLPPGASCPTAGQDARPAALLTQGRRQLLTAPLTSTTSTHLHKISPAAWHLENPLQHHR